MPAKLTDTAIAAAMKQAVREGVRKEIADPALPGLRLRITPAGTRTWVLGGRDADGRARRFQIGRYPEVGIADAREAARSLRQRVRHEGADPVHEARQRRKVAQDAASGVGTLGALVSSYEKQHGARLKRWAECDRRIRSVFGSLMDRPLVALRRGELQIAADEWPAAGSASAAVRYLKPILKWAVDRELCGPEIAMLRQPQPVKRRERVLSRDELAALLPKLAASASPYAAAMRLILLTACRREEVSSATWADVDLASATWRIPETKNGRPHTVPMSDQAAAVIRAQRPKDGSDPVPFAPVFRAKGGGTLDSWQKATKVLQDASGVVGWHRHDLRRTAATMMGEMGEPPHIIEAALNHAAIHSQLAATYNRSRYQPEVRAALQRLADVLDGIEAGAAKVVPLRRPA